MRSWALLSLCFSYAPLAHAYNQKPVFRATGLVVVIGATDSEANGGVAPVAVDFNILTPTSSGSAAPDIIAGDGFVMNSNSGWDAGHDFSGGATRFDIIDETSGGTWGNPGGGDIDYLEETDTLTQFGIDADTSATMRQSRHVSRFLVASNMPFDIFVEATNLTKTGGFSDLDYSNIGFRARINTRGGTGPGRWGDAAQNPAIGGSGIDANVNDLGDMSAGPVKMFDGGRRTARNRGRLLAQSVSFNIRYNLINSDGSEVYDFSMGSGSIGADVSYTVYTP